MNHGALFPIAPSAIPPTSTADEARSLSTIAAARQNEMKVSITVVATKTLAAGRRSASVSAELVGCLGVVDTAVRRPDSNARHQVGLRRDYSFSAYSHAEQDRYMPPAICISRLR